MVNKERFKLVNMVIREGSLEILELSKNKTPKRFADFKDLKNVRTGRYFSQTTVSDRLKDLVEINALMKVIIKVKDKKDVIGYKITPEGLKILDTAYEFEERLERIVKNNK